jgi:hypothetical protein
MYINYTIQTEINKESTMKQVQRKIYFSTNLITELKNTINFRLTESFLTAFLQEVFLIFYIISQKRKGSFVNFQYGI